MTKKLLKTAIQDDTISASYLVLLLDKDFKRLVRKHTRKFCKKYHKNYIVDLEQLILKYTSLLEE